jgi:NADPH:quinone reductase-like Zn-dependent oxidoreductase
MPETFKAILVSRDEDKKQSVAMTQLTDADLMEGDVTVAIEATTVNYKDGLAITGSSRVSTLPARSSIRTIPTGGAATRWCSMAGASAKRITALMRSVLASRETGWCRCRKA